MCPPEFFPVKVIQEIRALFVILKNVSAIHMKTQGLSGRSVFDVSHSM